MHYTVTKAGVPPVIDGSLNDPAWKAAAWTEYFSDIEGDLRPKPFYATRAKMLWDDQYLYIGAELEEPNIWAYVMKHDEIVFHDNDFEIFINPDNNARHYFEIEINAIGTIFDLYLPEPYNRGGGALINWDVQGLKKAVHLEGTKNHPGDTDHRWTVEFAIPIYAVSMGSKGETPVPGSLWRINFSRVEWDTEVQQGRYVKRMDSLKRRPLPEHNWVWSPQGVINMHFPERWGYLSFAGTAAGAGRQGNSQTAGDKGGDAFVLPLEEQMKNKLWEVYYRENVYFHTYKDYAGTASALDMEPVSIIAGKNAVLAIEATAHIYKALLTCPETGDAWSIDANGFLKNEGHLRQRP